MNGKVKIRLCMGSSCFTRGNNKAIELIKEYISENNLEQSIELSGSLCEGKCSSGPHITIDDKEYDDIKPESVLDLIRIHLREKGIIN
ncbi:NADP-reducing hydrogenase subunit HndA [Sedimentisphaera cyanobacteriorum]|uniref:NADP-reducing hydrogenase subunit HndA n=1 Tax=Sedimentisphaera cyanobacteriorum TaxID=1940790 RepID=A0A1Q2HQG5_9BACT|nr:NAD(P)H-dependent oxidoreductase subunit E [Sedimentisphaera cyanobacteriorum]AQQ09483.1 NADP-reducing hydrogenase subunit HndA [Sedimentisphaera cyanobacteriorum]